MKSTTNRVQRNYMVAKANLGALQDVERDMERKYIKAHGITNENGEIPEALYCIDDEVVFDRANHDFAEMPEAKANWKERLVAEETLKAAENALVEYGLSIAPAREREILRRSAAENYTTKRKIIDLVMRLDVSTVRA